MSATAKTTTKIAATTTTMTITLLARAYELKKNTRNEKKRKLFFETEIIKPTITL